MANVQTHVPSNETESFAAMFEESLARQEMRAGEVITAEVVRIDHNYVVVNAGLKSESFIPIEEFLNDRGELDVNEGDFVSVAIDALEDGYGETRLSRDRAKRLAAWLQLEKALEQQGAVKAVALPVHQHAGGALQSPAVRHETGIVAHPREDGGRVGGADLRQRGLVVEGGGGQFGHGRLEHLEQAVGRGRGLSAGGAGEPGEED